MMNRPIQLAPLCFLFFFPFLIFQESNAQTPPPPPTDPSEVRALNSLFQQWDLQAPAGSWNISGEPCSGTAINGLTKLDDDNVNVNPALICNCALDPVACHITQLRIHALNKRGVIPEELATLKYLQRIYIDKNSFTGTLPAFIGNLSGLITLSVGHNAFYGSIPKELGNLKELDMLALGTNNFSGTLPQELGYLPKLRLLYLDSSGIGGEIPSTFANLTNMVDLFTADSPFTGKIPDFIGNWTKLSRLRIQGNNFEGPIPSSFSNLTLLTSLRITDLHNVSSSLDFIKNMRNLTDLILRNALISDTLPLDIDKYQRLRTLDLSFNNITGPLPSRLMNMTALTSLFLGNNSLSGSLLPQMNDRLQNIDFSYNELSGTFPQWVYPSWPDLQLNLVGNNFRFDSSNISSFPGLHCLQRNFPCNRNPPPNADFSINCGGPAVRSSDGTLYEAENSTALGPAAYYVTQEKWAVSNVGVVIDRDNLNLTYIIPTNVQVANTTTPKLFRTSRTSPGSLRYYGLGLQNRTYNVSLFFAETRISERSTQTWGSHGRRVFDIYVQGIRREKDFDISKEAGGVNRAIQKSYQVTVTQNYLEIHLFWAGKGTCCIPEYGDYGPLISAVSVSSGSRSSAGGSKKSRTGLIVGISVAGGVVSLTLLILLLYFKRRGSKQYEEEEILELGPKPNTYSYSELKTATDDFNPSNKLGEGGFGPVYKGKLNDGRIVAVKQLSVASHQGKSQFITEISTISAVQHWNLVKLYGFCAEGPKRLLVYEYLENRSLDQSLFGKNDLHINWPTRFSICLGTARGLAYLHEESRPRIVHRDVKASNILLDAELCPKISDFGLAKLYDDKKTHISTRVAGTIGYLAPEYAMRGHLTSKADVFGFGVVSLEILSGRPNFDDGLDVEKKYLLEWAWSLHVSNRGLELVDPTLTTFNEQEAMRVLGVALLCTQASPAMRPSMSRVVGMLAGDIEVNAVTTKPSYLTDWDFSDITTSSSYLDQEEPLTSNTSSGVDALPSSLNSSESMLSETIRDGRYIQRSKSYILRRIGSLNYIA